MIEAISHITMMVADLDRTSRFLTAVFEAKEIYASNGKEFSLAKEKYFSINGLWIVIMEGDSLPSKTYNHVAFKIDEKDFDLYLNRLESLQLEFTEGRERIVGEGRSLYFYDYDNHLFELHTGNLKDRLNTYLLNREES